MLALILAVNYHSTIQEASQERIHYRTPQVTCTVPYEANTPRHVETIQWTKAHKNRTMTGSDGRKVLLQMQTRLDSSILYQRACLMCGKPVSRAMWMGQW